ncbi:MAG: glycosyltransferase family 39 protein [Candidatus Omnitrophota bacterium]
MNIQPLPFKEKLFNLLNSHYCILSGILTVGTFFRFYKLTSKSLWYDEACSLSFVYYDWSTILYHRYMSRPLYFIFLRFWVSLFGQSEFSTRSLSVILGVLSILLIYRLGKLLFNKNVGLISASILSLSGYHIYYSQQLRNYSFFVFLGILSMIVFIKALRKKKHFLVFIYTITSILLLGSHPFGIFAFLTQGVFLSIFYKKFQCSKLLLSSQIIIIILSVFISLFFINNQIGIKDNELNYIAKPGFHSILETLEVFSYGGYRQAHGGIGYKVNLKRLIAPRLLTFIFCTFFIFGAFLIKKNKFYIELPQNSKYAIVLLLCWFFVTLFGAYLFSRLLMPIYLTRYLILASVAFYILIARGIEQITMGKLKLISIFLITIFSFISLDILYNPGSREDWREAGKYIKNNIGYKDTIILAPINQIVPFWYYYKYLVKMSLKDIDRCGKRVGNGCREEFYDDSNYIQGIKFSDNSEAIDEKLRRSSELRKDIWLVISPDWITQKASKLIYERIQKKYNLISKSNYTYNGVEVLHYVYNANK